MNGDNKMKKISLYLSVIKLCFIISSLYVSAQPIGIFDDHSSYGLKTIRQGEATYDPNTEKYTVSGSSSPVTIDGRYRPLGGHSVYKKIHSDTDFILEAHVFAEHLSSNSDWAAAVLSIKEDNRYVDDLDNTAPFYQIGIRDAARSGQFDTLVLSMQVEPGRYWVTFWYKSTRPNHDGHLRIAKTGNLMSAYYFDIDQQVWVLYDETDIYFRDTFYRVGLDVYAAYNDGSFTKGVFSDVKLTIFNDLPVDNWELHK